MKLMIHTPGRDIDGGTLHGGFTPYSVEEFEFVRYRAITPQVFELVPNFELIPGNANALALKGYVLICTYANDAFKIEQTLTTIGTYDPIHSFHKEGRIYIFTRELFHQWMNKNLLIGEELYRYLTENICKVGEELLEFKKTLK